MPLAVINNFETTLLAGMNNSQLTMVISNAMAQRLQDEVFTPGNTIRLTLERGTTREIVEVSAQTQDTPTSGQATLTIDSRAVEKVSASAATAYSFLAGSKVEGRLTAGDVEDNLRGGGGGGGGGGLTVIYDDAGGTVNVNGVAGAEVVVWSNIFGSNTYNLVVPTGAGEENKFYKMTVLVGNYGPGATASVTVNGSSAFDVKGDDSISPVGYNAGKIELFVLTDGSGAIFKKGVLYHQYGA